jgi:hypothetical protein
VNTDPWYDTLMRFRQLIYICTDKKPPSNNLGFVRLWSDTYTWYEVSFFLAQILPGDASCGWEILSSLGPHSHRIAPSLLPQTTLLTQRWRPEWNFQPVAFVDSGAGGSPLPWVMIFWAEHTLGSTDMTLAVEYLHIYMAYVYIYVCVWCTLVYICIYHIYTVYIYILQFVVWYSSLQVKINHSVAEIIAAQHWKIHWISKSGTCNKLPL